MSSIPRQVSNTLQSLVTLTEAGIIRLQRPDRALRTAVSLIRWGVTPAAGYEASAARYPDEVALIDELGQLTFREIQQRTNALAHALADDGVNEGDNVAIMARNHRGFVEAVVACSKLGAHALFLNTSFSGPQLTDVADREKPKAIIYDEEFAEVLADAGHRRKRYIAWNEPEGETKDPTLESLIERGDPAGVVPPAEPGQGDHPHLRHDRHAEGRLAQPAEVARPGRRAALEDPAEGAREDDDRGAAVPRLGLRALHARHGPLVDDRAQAQVRRGGDAVADRPARLHRARRRAGDAPAHPRARRRGARPLRPLGVKAVPVSGSALPGDLSKRWMDHFGDNLYNLYGSTEVAWATIATPKDLREAPGTAGKPPRGTVVKIYDDEGNEVQTGETGRIFVGNDLQFEGYTGGGNKDVIDGLMSSGDVGHFDDAGRLFIDGRDDDMIVSGGENVFPQEVEDLLSGHESIKEAAVFGVDDEKFGQRLKAVVVTKGSKKVSADEVKKYVKSNLAGYKVPRDVVFVDELPRTSTGKVLKRELKED